MDYLDEVIDKLREWARKLDKATSKTEYCDNISANLL